MRQIYINAKQTEESRVVVVENNQLIGYEQELAGEENRKGNIYSGVVTHLENSLEAAFVDFGDEKNGFLPFKDIPDGAHGVSLGGLQIGDCLLVQIKKDHIGDKGAGLTSYISLAGCYLVLQPNRSSSRTTISRHSSRENRQQMLQTIQSLTLPDGMSVILRTAGLGRSAEELTWDLESYLLKLWEAIVTISQEQSQPLLIYRENNLLLHVARDYFRPSDSKIICDHLEKYQEMQGIVSLMFPNNANDVEYHDHNEDMIPAAVEMQIDHVFDREISTSSGVRVVFDSTEALVSIDVNSGRLRGGADVEETALNANLEAAEVIASQLRLRNLAGLIVVDFIDMEYEKNQKKLENHFFHLLKTDRARIRCTNISKFGLVEISRQRLSRSLVSSQESTCPHCSGTGQIWRTEAFAIRLLRKMRIMAADTSVGALLVQAPTNTATYLLNEKRIEIRRMEDDFNCIVVVAPNSNMYPPAYRIKPLKGNIPIDDSYQIIADRQDEQLSVMRAQLDRRQSKQQPQPIIKNLLPQKSAPQKQKSWMDRLTNLLFSRPAEKETPPATDINSQSDKNSVQRESRRPSSNPTRPQRQRQRQANASSRRKTESNELSTSSNVANNGRQQNSPTAKPSTRTTAMKTRAPSTADNAPRQSTTPNDVNADKTISPRSEQSASQTTNTRRRTANRSIAVEKPAIEPTNTSATPASADNPATRTPPSRRARAPRPSVKPSSTDNPPPPTKAVTEDARPTEKIIASDWVGYNADKPSTNSKPAATKPAITPEPKQPAPVKQTKTSINNHTPDMVVLPSIPSTATPPPAENQARQNKSSAPPA